MFQAKPLPGSLAPAIGVKLLILVCEGTALVALTRPQGDHGEPESPTSTRGYVCVFASEAHSANGSAYICDFALATAALSLIYQWLSTYVLLCLDGRLSLPGWRHVCSISSARADENLLMILAFLFEGIFFVLNMASFCLQLAGHMTEGNRASDKLAVRLSIGITTGAALLTCLAMFYLARFAQGGGKVRSCRRRQSEVGGGDAAISPRYCLAILVLVSALLCAVVTLACLHNLQHFETPALYSLPLDLSAANASFENAASRANDSNSTQALLLNITCVFGESDNVCQLVTATSALSLILSAIFLLLGFFEQTVVSSKLIVLRMIMSFALAVLWLGMSITTLLAWQKRDNELILLQERHRNVMAVLTCSIISTLAWTIVAFLFLCLQSNGSVDAHESLPARAANSVWQQRLCRLKHGQSIPRADAHPLLVMGPTSSRAEEDEDGVAYYGSVHTGDDRPVCEEMPP